MTHSQPYTHIRRHTHGPADRDCAEDHTGTHVLAWRLHSLIYRCGFKHEHRDTNTNTASDTGTAANIDVEKDADADTSQ